MGFGRPSWSGPVDLNATLTMSHFSWGPRYPQFLPVPSSTPITCHPLLLGTSCLHPTLHMHVYLPNTQTFPPMSLLCTPVLHLPTPVTVRLPSDVPHCTQNFPQLSTYTLSSKRLFTSLKPLTILWGILKICLIYHSALNTVQNIMCLLNNLINKSAGHRQSKSIS